MKTIVSIASIIGTIASTTPALAQGGKSYYCEGKSSITMDGQTKNTTLTAWMKAPTIFHLEQKSGAVTQTVISNGKDVWMKASGQNEYLHRLQNPQMLAAMSKKLRVIGDDMESIVKVGAKKTGTETLQGSKCDVYSTTKDGITHTIWIIQGPEKLTKQDKLSGVRKAALGPGQPMSNHTMNRVVTYNWKVGVPVDEAKFHLPPGAKVKEFTSPASGMAPPIGAPPKR